MENKSFDHLFTDNEVESYRKGLVYLTSHFLYTEFETHLTSGYKAAVVVSWILSVINIYLSNQSMSFDVLLLYIGFLSLVPIMQPVNAAIFASTLINTESFFSFFVLLVILGGLWLWIFYPGVFDENKKYPLDVESVKKFSMYRDQGLGLFTSLKKVTLSLPSLNRFIIYKNLKEKIEETLSKLEEKREDNLGIFRQIDFDIVNDLKILKKNLKNEFQVSYNLDTFIYTFLLAIIRIFSK